MIQTLPSHDRTTLTHIGYLDRSEKYENAKVSVVQYQNHSINYSCTHAHIREHTHTRWYGGACTGILCHAQTKHGRKEPEEREKNCKKKREKQHHRRTSSGGGGGGGICNAERICSQEIFGFGVFFFVHFVHSSFHFMFGIRTNKNKIKKKEQRSEPNTKIS